MTEAATGKQAAVIGAKVLQVLSQQQHMCAEVMWLEAVQQSSTLTSTKLAGATGLHRATTTFWRHMHGNNFRNELLHQLSGLL